MTVTPEQLKEAIKGKKVECVNLTLTSDNRLINKGKQEKDKIYISPSCKWTPYGTDTELDKLVYSNFWGDRLEAAEQGYGLDKLINDEHWDVREAVAKQGYGLDKLVNDEYYSVRKAVAKQGYGLDKLVNDESYEVRVVVAKHGYGLDKLVNDEDEDVREAVQEYLKDNSYKSISDWIKANPDKVYNK